MANTNITPRAATKVRPSGEFIYVDSNSSQLLDGNGQPVTLNDQGETSTKRMEHSHIQDPSLLHQTFHYEQPTDPGAVGAGLFWLNKTLTEIPPGSGTFGYQLSWRNDANDGWVTI